MITLENDRLVFRFPEVHERATFAVALQRTLRIPDDGRDYPLPPGLGRFPLRHVDDLGNRLPERERRRGGVILPMYQAEALWLEFETPDRWETPYPIAVKVGTGKVNAVTGEPWSGHLNGDPQDYVTVPEQRWLDGYCVETQIVRQFVAMPLGLGYSVEEQIAGSAEIGGIQIMAWPMKAHRYEQLVRRAFDPSAVAYSASPELHAEYPGDMALAPGGRMRQTVHEDDHGLAAWDQRHASRCFVTIANSAQWTALTGERPPTLPPTARDYSEAGLPWFDDYGGDARALGGAATLAGAKSVREIGDLEGEDPLGPDASAWPKTVLPTRKPRRIVVREEEL